ncbi:MAG: hypothetical protein IKG30_12905 [Clostridiales bacterium]|nr:hypothetical protein [Clostridiales bacterium]
MGSGFGFKCSCCGHEYDICTGIGMRFPQVYEKLLSSIKQGKYGSEWKALALSEDYVAVEAERFLYFCDTCHNWKVDYGLSLYAPNDPEVIKKKKYGIKTVEEWGEVPYVTSWEDYHLLKEYAHKCDKCSCSMRRASDREFFSLPCPKCGSNPEPDYLSCINWD